MVNIMNMITSGKLSLNLLLGISLLVAANYPCVGVGKSKDFAPPVKLEEARGWVLPPAWRSWKPGQSLKLMSYPEAPFWKTKAKIKKQITENRRIVVSVLDLEQKSKRGPKKLLVMKGVGHFARSAKDAYSFSKNFKNLKNLGFFIREITFDKKNHTLFLHAEAFSYHAYMLMLVDFVELPKKGGFGEIQFRVVKVVFSGMTGRLRFEDIGRRKAEVSIVAQYGYNELSIPKFFVNFGLEVVLHRVAGKLREMVEGQGKS